VERTLRSTVLWNEPSVPRFHSRQAFRLVYHAEMPTLLTQDETAEMLRLTERQLNRLARDGAIPSIALPNGQLRFEADAIRDWIDSLRRPATEGK
jgi:hypothetical protein